MRSLDKLVILTLMCLAVSLQSGCAKWFEKPQQPTPRIGVDRVVFVGLEERNSSPGVARDMTVALSHTIKACEIFKLDVVDRKDPACEYVPDLGRAGLTLEQIRKMREVFQCDGVLLGEMHDFRPHPRMQLGLTLRLVDMKKGRVLWAVDRVWDTTDKAVEKRIEDYFTNKMSERYAPMDWRIAMISPKMFEKFIAYELAEDLKKAAHKLAAKNNPKMARGK
ncbi:MAG: hypothetical protein GY794_10160 [bacterium]|nr:hypothetical protein [bacterium]